MGYTNSQKLAAVINAWAQPAISQFTSSKLSRLPFILSLRELAVNCGIIDANYDICADLEPIIKPFVSSMLQPWLEMQFAKLPDSTIPIMARNVVKEALKKGTLSLMDGYLNFEREDLNELMDLIEKNLPLNKEENYEIIK